MSDLFALVALVGLDRSKHSRLHKAYQELVADIDAGNAVSLEKVLQIGLKHARRSSRPVTALAALRMDCSCDPTSGYKCPNWPNCASDSRGNTPRSARSSSTRSTRSPRPRGFMTQFAQDLAAKDGLARDLDAKYKNDGLKPEYSVYAVALAVNDIAPEQVLIDNNIKGPDMFAHPDAGRHLYEAVRQSLPDYLPSGSSGFDSSYSEGDD